MKKTRALLASILFVAIILFALQGFMPSSTSTLAQGPVEGGNVSPPGTSPDEDLLPAGAAEELSPPILSPAETVTPTLHTPPILEIDRKTGQRLTSVAVPIETILGPAQIAEIQRQREEKRKAIDETLVIFRSGDSLHTTPGIEDEVRQQLSMAQVAIGYDIYYLIQFGDVWNEEARALLKRNGVVFFDYYHNNAFYARIPLSALPLLEKMVAAGTVRYVGRIPPVARIQPRLAAKAQDSPDEERRIVVQFFEEVGAEQLEELGSLMRIETQAGRPLPHVRGTANGRAIQLIHQLSFVKWVEEEGPNRIDNLEGVMEQGGDVIIDLGSFDGSGVIVAVNDTGIAQSGGTFHPDLPSSRITHQHDYYYGDNWAVDQNSHGTHVAGSVGGEGNSSAAWMGMAPGADFLIYQICSSGGSCSSTAFENAITDSASRSANVSGNSWSCGACQNQYNTDSEIVDRAVRGEYSGHIVNVVFSSGNDNHVVNAPATAKNGFTVGAICDGNWPNQTVNFWGSPPSVCSEVIWPPAKRACFSNYGPVNTDGNSYTRVKPDVMATGPRTMSTVPWYLYGDSRYYDLKDGTSMSQPKVSGALALILDAYPDLAGWPEELKALVLSTAVDVGGDTGNYGRGLIDTFHAIYNSAAASVLFWTGSSVSDPSDDPTYTFEVPSGFEEVRVVLTWTDPAGSTEGINDLDLRVYDADDNWVGSSTSFDDNVEYVKATSGTPGTWSATVDVFALNGATPQYFGLVVVAIMEDPSLSVSSNVSYIYRPHSVDPGQTFFLYATVSNSGYTAGGSYLRLRVPNTTYFKVEGCRIYTRDGREHYYDDPEIYNTGGGTYWRVAVGEVVAGYARQVRWFIQVNPGTPSGVYEFQSQAWFQDAGSGGPGSNVSRADVAVTYFSYLPLILKSY